MKKQIFIMFSKMSFMIYKVFIYVGKKLEYKV